MMQTSAGRAIPHAQAAPHHARVLAHDAHDPYGMSFKPQSYRVRDERRFLACVDRFWVRNCAGASHHAAACQQTSARQEEVRVHVLCAEPFRAPSGKKVYFALLPHDGKYIRQRIGLASELSFDEARQLAGELLSRPRQPSCARRAGRAGEKVGVNRVARLMREEGVCGRRRPRFRKTTNSNHDRPIAANVLGREFQTEEPDRVWVGDISYVWTRQGWAYLAVIIDLFSRRVVGWSLADHMRTELALDALRAALEPPTVSCIQL